MTETPTDTTASDAAAIAEGCYFDEAKAAKGIAWIERTLCIVLYIWEREILRRYLGWRTAAGGYRFTKLYIWLPKKNGKTFLIAVLVAYKLFELRFARIYSAAFNAMQAKIVMEELIKICRKAPALARMMKPRGKLKAFCTPFRRDFTNDITGSKYTALADNINANDGLIPDVIVLDEIHRMKNSQVDVLEGSTANNPDALKVIISTAGSGDKGHRSWQKYTYTKRVISGEIIDTQLLPIVFECPDAAKLKGTEIYDLDRLIACNPVLQEVPEKRAQAARDLEEARELRNDLHWRRFRLNQWVAMDGEAYIDATVYDKCETTEELDTEGAEAFIGLDKSGGVWDFHAITALIRLEDGRTLERHFTFASADRLEPMGEQDERDYSKHIDAGEIIVIPADAITDEFIYEWSIAEFENYDVKRIAGDPYSAANLLERWKGHGWEVVAVQQSNNRLLTPVIDDYAQRIRQGRIVHHPNELVSWQLSCARSFTTAKDCKKIVKQGTNVKGQGGTGHIDNIDALLNALAAMRADEVEEDTSDESGNVYAA